MRKQDWTFWALVFAIICTMLTQAVSYGKMQSAIQRGVEERAMLSTTQEKLWAEISELNGNIKETNGYLRGLMVEIKKGLRDTPY